MLLKFRDAFLFYLDVSGFTLAEVARLSDVSVEQLKKLKQRETATTNVDDAAQIAHAFGVTLDEMLGDKLPEQRAEALSAYARLTREERQFLRTLAKAQRASPQQAS